MRRVVLLLLLCGVAAVAGVSGAVASETSAERFLADLEMVQQQIASIEITGEGREYDINWRTGEVTENPYSHRFTLRMDRLPHGRARLDYDGVIRAATPDGPTVAHPISEQFAYNGDVRTYIRWSADGVPSDQEIDAGQCPMVGTGSSYWGIDLLATTYKNKGLARVLREKGGEWSVEDRGDGVFAVGYQRGDDVRIELLVDLSRNGIITERLFWVPEDPEDPGGREYMEVHGRGEFEQTDGGIWLPRHLEVTATYAWIRKIDLSAKANISFPDDIFVLEFVPGYEVRDRIAGVSFTAGFESDNAMLLQIVESLSDVEEARDAPWEPSARAASGAQPLEAETLAEARRRWPWLVALGCLVLAAAAVIVLRHRPRGIGMLLLLLASSCPPLAAAAGVSGAVASETSAERFLADLEPAQRQITSIEIAGDQPPEAGFPAPQALRVSSPGPATTFWGRPARKAPILSTVVWSILSSASSLLKAI